MDLFFKIIFGSVLAVVALICACFIYSGLVCTGVVIQTELIGHVNCYSGPKLVFSCDYYLAGPNNYGTRPVVCEGQKRFDIPVNQCYFESVLKAEK